MLPETCKETMTPRITWKRTWIRLYFDMLLAESAIVSSAFGSSVAGVLNWINTGCWAACFFWMWRISRNQNELLRELKDQNCRIEKLSKAEHDLIKEVHPQVAEIKDHLDEVSETMKENGALK